MRIFLSSMGQANTVITEPLSNMSVDKIQEELFRQARQLSAAATCSYEDFQNCLKDLNSLSSHVTSHSGKRLFFAVKKGTDETLLWRATIRIAVVQMDATYSRVDSHRLLTLPQFLRVFSTLQGQMVSALRHSSSEEEPTDLSSTSQNDTASNQHGSPTVAGRRTKLVKRKEMTYSMLLEEVNQVVSESSDKLVECCICLERRPDIILPCAHAFCTSCIEQWNSSHKTCPICREILETTDDAWVISDIPGSEDISREICSALMDLSADPDASRT